MFRVPPSIRAGDVGLAAPGQCVGNGGADLPVTQKKTRGRWCCGQTLVEGSIERGAGASLSRRHGRAVTRQHLNVLRRRG